MKTILELIDKVAESYGKKFSLKFIDNDGNTISEQEVNPMSLTSTEFSGFGCKVTIKLDDVELVSFNTMGQNQEKSIDLPTKPLRFSYSGGTISGSSTAECVMETPVNVNIQHDYN